MPQGSKNCHRRYSLVTPNREFQRRVMAVIACANLCEKGEKFVEAKVHVTQPDVSISRKTVSH